MAGRAHRRYNPLIDEWVLVSAGRTQRPWLGGVDEPAAPTRVAYDPMCFLCPGNERSSGEANPPYAGVHAFTNDFPALEPQSGAVGFDDGLFRAVGAAGTCRVICYSAAHDLSLGELPPDRIAAVIDVWADESAELGQRDPWVQIFENRGAAMGASSPHPHGQVWASSIVPREGAREDAAQQTHFERSGSVLLADYVERERRGPRVVEENEEWSAVVPFWAVWPFETLLIARSAAGSLPELDRSSRAALADLLRRVLARYDGLFDTPFPYSMGWHQAPFDGRSRPWWRLHGHVYPPLLRSAAVRKHMVGYELLSESQRDLTAEDAACRLRLVAPTRR
ncbi:MAG: UDP-glucose--hexose-1-phosphate uridylyltransferase [Chloroflexi bacterium]|nr:UDP-glucose--hexose-1-phosphate uridylyltransferase [Chloroflexota bacterium]